MSFNVSVAFLWHLLVNAIGHSAELSGSLSFENHILFLSWRRPVPNLTPDVSVSRFSCSFSLFNFINAPFAMLDLCLFLYLSQVLFHVDLMFVDVSFFHILFV